jgi:hypothetical protein
MCSRRLVIISTPMGGGCTSVFLWNDTQCQRTARLDQKRWANCYLSFLIVKAGDTEAGVGRRDLSCLVGSCVLKPRNASVREDCSELPLRDVVVAQRDFLPFYSSYFPLICQPQTRRRKYLSFSVGFQHRNGDCQSSRVHS